MRNDTTSTRPRRVAAAAPVLGAAFVLIAPIILWAQLGDGDPRRTIEVALGAAILAWAVARRAEDRVAAAAATSAPVHRRATRTTSSRHAGAPAPAPRLRRDVGCETAHDRRSQRRPARRRSRP